MTIHGAEDLFAPTKSFLATAAISKGQAVVLGAAGYVTLATSAVGVIGKAKNDAVTGGSVVVALLGNVATVYADGTSPIVIGDALTVNSAGSWVKAASGASALAVALEALAVVGYIEVIFTSTAIAVASPYTQTFTNDAGAGLVAGEPVKAGSLAGHVDAVTSGTLVGFACNVAASAAQVTVSLLGGGDHLKLHGTNNYLVKTTSGAYTAICGQAHTGASDTTLLLVFEATGSD
jgi:hypothetical protein